MMSSAPFVSVIIAAYNASTTLQKAIDSVLSQHEVSLELIVIDGGSNDGTVPLLQAYGDHIAYWISEPDLGIYDAWNKGILVSRGSWISFIGADDYYLPGALLAYKEFISVHQELDYISSSIVLYSDHSSVQRVIGKKWAWKSFRHYMDVAHVGSFHSSRLFMHYGCFNIEYSICADYELLMRAKSSLKAGFIPQSLAFMRAGGISNSSINGILESMKIKKYHASVPNGVAQMDCAFAIFKWYLRFAYSRLVNAFNSFTMNTL